MPTDTCATKSDRRIAFFGDSHVVGVGDADGLGWVGRITQHCAAAGVPITPYNLGVRGDTSVQVADRWRDEALRRMPVGCDNRIVLSFGVNDTTFDAEASRVPPDESVAALDRILAEARTLGFPALFVGPAPVDAAEQNDRIRALSARFADMCAGHAVHCISPFDRLLAAPTWMREIALDDGAHPRSAGYAMLADIILEHGWMSWLTSAPLGPN
jgi:acyl-CoA thioesterase I